MDNFAQFNSQQMLTRPMGNPSDSGAGKHFDAVINGGLLGTVFGINDTKGLLTPREGLFGVKTKWVSDRQQGPLARAFQEFAATLKQGGTSMMEGVGPGENIAPPTTPGMPIDQGEIGIQ